MTREITEEQRRQLVDKLGLERADDPLAVIRKQRGFVLPVIQSLGITSSAMVMVLMLFIALCCALVVFGVLLMFAAIIEGVIFSHPLTSGPLFTWIAFALALPSLITGLAVSQKMFSTSFLEVFRDGKETFLYGREERALLEQLQQEYTERANASMEVRGGLSLSKEAREGGELTLSETRGGELSEVPEEDASEH